MGEGPDLPAVQDHLQPVVGAAGKDGLGAVLRAVEVDEAGSAKCVVGLKHCQSVKLEVEGRRVQRSETVREHVPGEAERES